MDDVYGDGIWHDSTMKISSSLLFIAGLAIIAAACGDSSDGESQPGGEAAATTTAAAESTTTASRVDSAGFATEVLPILENSCARCHTGNGPGTSHLRLDTVGDAIENSRFIVEAVRLEIMPPWPSSNLSVAFRDNWSLSDEEREAIVEWARRPLTDLDPSTPIVSSARIQTLTDVDMEISPTVGYDGEAGQPDEYRCFIYDPGFTEDTWLRGYEFVPDHTEVVHHAIGYVIPAERMDTAVQLDAADGDNGGWSCFGSSGTGSDEIFLGWAPGQGPTELPEGSGLMIPGGDFLVVQVHYHFEDDAPPDFSSLRLDTAAADELPLDNVETVEFVSPAEIPCTSQETGPLCDRAAALAEAVSKYGIEGVLADSTLFICRSSVEDFAHMTNGTASSKCDLPARATGELISVLGHEHELGTSFRMTLNPGTADEVILLDIPKWDFDWQLNYYPEDTFEISARDTVRIECSWDRALRDTDLEPSYIVWADGTNDEMCFATMLIRER